MIRVTLSVLAVAAVLCASAMAPAAREPILPKKPKEIVVVGGGTNKQQPKTISGTPRRARPGNLTKGQRGQQKHVNESIQMNFGKVKTRNGGSAPGGCATPGNCWPTHKPQN